MNTVLLLIPWIDVQATEDTDDLIGKLYDDTPRKNLLIVTSIPVSYTHLPLLYQEVAAFLLLSKADHSSGLFPYCY